MTYTTPLQPSPRPSKQSPTRATTIIHDVKSPSFSALKTQRTMIFAYGFTFAFVLCTVILVLNPSSYSSPWFNSIFHTASYRSHFSSFFPHFFPQNPQFPSLSHPQENANKGHKSNPLQFSRETDRLSKENNNASSGKIDGISSENKKTQYQDFGSASDVTNHPQSVNRNEGSKIDVYLENNVHSKSPPHARKGFQGGEIAKKGTRKGIWLESMSNCDIFSGRWVKDDSYPLYEPGSCPYIDEPFNCFLNGRPDSGYQKYRWQPINCNIPRLDGRYMLELMRGKRLVYVGDSLNRNMWESMVCILRNFVEDTSRVFEASGKEEFRTEGSYSFVFQDYNCSVEFFQSPFLVQEWEVPDNNGSKKETLRIDLVERSCERYKTADFLIFNTGHWWTHEKTSKGKGYYQEGSHVHGELNVVEAFRRAMTTWARWVNANINPSKTLVFFRGYSASHFSGGSWNSGGQCDSETEPIRNDKYLSEYPWILEALESILRRMQIPVVYFNITRMTDYRKDAHPSIYRKQYLSEEEKRSPLRYQDCSHWCLPGVPDTWNELIYTHILIKHYQKRQQQRTLLVKKHKNHVVHAL